ncbi:adenosylcobinamide-phosphate synthase CbiB [Luteibacter aegosomatissinici]|uniref:adenosylcobinamide-phosphate synthase CbiB n=1 Tax=Luteibacter aegosomatissinici TaxID=2911539 RepID=UPI001FFB92C4|nr:adenosylcobinamide-phosphate synthase CbiB [Luteibacter aegosomatissinici]UPG96769.1 adenosylcobinamide-phosphate synthase CbiB [Luteibacter aegosomatissinici]
MALLLAVGLDALLGEPVRWHPLVAFGRYAGMLERRFHADSRWAGVAAWCLAVLVPCAGLLAVRAASTPALAFGIDVLVLYAAIGRRSLGEHARPIADALDRGDLVAARTAVGWMVSRDTVALDAAQVAGAATESVLENGHDAVFGALFWFALLGGPGALLFRLANTLDAMWGYRTPRFLRFGWAAARIDDVLGFIPARFTALTYAAMGHFDSAWCCWRGQAPLWKSPNAGPVMAAGAGALQVVLGGPAPYHGQWQPRPVLGEGEPPAASSIRAALRLVDRGVVAWLCVALLVGAAAHA